MPEFNHELENRIAGIEHFLNENYYRQYQPGAAIIRTRLTVGSIAQRALAHYYDRNDNIVDHAWQTYAQAMRAAIAGGADWPNLQMVAPLTPEKILWDNISFGPYYFHKITADLINDTGSTYAKSSRSFSERYLHFLTDVKRTPIDSDAEQKARDALKEFDQAGKDDGELQLSIRIEWRHYDDRQRSSLPPSDWISADDWYEITGRYRVLSASKELVDLKFAKYLYFLQQAYGSGETLYKMLESWYKNEPIQVNVPRIGNKSDGKVNVRGYQITPDYPGWLQQVSAAPTPISFSLRHDSDQYDFSKEVIAAGIGIGFGFFGILAAGQRTTVKIDTKREGFEMTFKADMQSFNITPGAWYDSSAFELFHDGPFFPGSPMDNLQKKGALFGLNGYINFRPARAIVAYKPEVTIKLAMQEYHYFRQVTSGVAGFFIGPFAIGVGGYYKVEESVRWDDQKFTITLFNAPSIPHLIAFDSEAFK